MAVSVVTASFDDVYNFSLLNTIRYDTKEEFNVDSKADDQLNLAHVARKK